MKAAGFVGIGGDWRALTAALRQAFVRLARMGCRSPDSRPSGTHGGAVPLHARPAVWMSSAQHAWRPPSRSSHPRPPQWPHAAGQQAAMPCEPEMLPAGHSHSDATGGSTMATASKDRAMPPLCVAVCRSAPPARRARMRWRVAARCRRQRRYHAQVGYMYKARSPALHPIPPAGVEICVVPK